MKTLMELFVFIILMLFHGESQSQSQVANANLDPNENAIVGKTVTIQSKFTGLPLVEPHISAHPANNDHLLVAAMVVTDVNNPYESCRLSSFISKDGGTTWTETAHNWWGYDPWTAMSSNGHTVMAWIGTKGSFQDQYPIQFFTSDDGGITWNDNVQTLGGGHDGTKLAALNEEFYFTTVRFRNDMGADVILYRRAGKAKFEEVARIDGKGERLNFCEPAMLSDGTVIVPASHF
ncbi:MAG: exo-alpha-sialidase [Saprospiraceae bacterium]|nr:exo-alpha-sialidase [Saprospiraceae bacterium]